ncbi:MAG: phosphonate ABC transporter ATP-binding protein [Proteobacteria bacterium]|nr:phosphonate ABC transporter ATP-binding protein [Burkholderiales bacterium]
MPADALPLNDAPPARAIALDGLSVVYPNGTVGLHPTRLAFAPGEFVVLLGPSGAGKSTLLRSLNGLVSATTGTIDVEGIGSITARGALRRHRQRCAMVFQQHQLIGRLTTLRNVLTGRLAYRTTLRSMWPMPLEDKRIALDCLERVGMLDCALRRVDELSGGQQQRVGIARAIAQEPRILLADEPVASLDPATSVKVLGLIHAICKADGITAVVSLHQVHLARQFADRIVGIGAGRVVFDGPPTQIDEAMLAAIYGSLERAERDDWSVVPTPVADPDAGRVRDVNAIKSDVVISA